MTGVSGLILFAFGCLLYYGLSSRTREGPRSRLPPGPKPWPIVGNITDLPPHGTPDYEHWLKHKDKYGPISSITVLGRTMVILHGREAIRQLLDKSSSKTSGRPTMEFASMCGSGEFLGLRRFDDAARRHRKLIHTEFGTPTLVRQYSHVLEAETAHLLLRTLEAPHLVQQHFGTLAAAIILKIGYGYSVEPKGSDPMVRLVQRMMANVSESVVPMKWPVDIMPFLKHYPEWLPGGSFHKTAALWKKFNEAVCDIPYDFVRQRMRDGTGESCFVAKHVDKELGRGPELDAETEEAVKLAAANIYAGGSDTTVSSLSSFTLAMVKFPDVQRRAQEEIDGLTRGERLPRIEDREALPYVDALAQEVLRWFPVIPGGVPHTVDEDTTFEGYSIPKGTILLPAIWWLLHDPQVYAEPDRFDPSRFLSPRNEPDPKLAAFGFGRRICPGRWMADASVFLGVAQILATFHIDKALDDDGRPMEPKVEGYSEGGIDRPVDFPYRITPRGPKHVDLIQMAQLKYPWEAGDSGNLPARQELDQLIA